LCYPWYIKSEVDPFTVLPPHQISGEIATLQIQIFLIRKHYTILKSWF